jgi:hypothetical protein
MDLLKNDLFYFLNHESTNLRENYWSPGNFYWFF